MKWSAYIAVAFIFLAPSMALADASVGIGALNPGTTVGAGAPVSFSVTTSGFTGSVTYRVADSFAGGVTTTNIDTSGNFFWTPNAEDIGTHTITVTVTDSSGDTAEAAQTITVVGHGVSFSVSSTTVEFGTYISFNVTSTGFSSPSYQMTDSFPYSTASYTQLPATGTFSWLPVYQDIGTHVFTVTARDYTGSATASATITVLGPPGAGVSAQATSSAPVPFAGTSTPAVVPIGLMTSVTSAAPSTPTSSSPPVFVSFLSVGSTGAQVTALQQKLSQLGFFTVSATGYFGNVTRAAVIAFQKSVGLDQVGWVGPGTRAALNKL